MNTKTLSIIAIGLWLLSAVAVATMFINGNTGVGIDGRTAIYVNHTERELILKEMRGFLHSFQQVLEGIDKGNMALVKKQAGESGSAEIESMPPMLMAKLPIQFKQWGRAVHREFDAIATAIEQGEERADLLGRVALQLKGCIACHETYRIELEQNTPL